MDFIQRIPVVFGPAPSTLVSLRAHGVTESAARTHDEKRTRALSRIGGELMVFSKHLREGIRRGRVRCSVRIWMRPHVKVGGRYKMDNGHIVVDSVEEIAFADITDDLARESGFDSVEDLLGIARHGRGDPVYLIRFHYLPPGAWDTPRWKQRHAVPS